MVKPNNQQILKKENDDLKAQISSHNKEFHDWQTIFKNLQRPLESKVDAATLSTIQDMEASIEFVSGKYDNIESCRKASTTKFNEISAILKELTKQVQDLATATDNLEAYSYCSCN